MRPAPETPQAGPPAAGSSRARVLRSARQGSADPEAREPRGRVLPVGVDDYQRAAAAQVLARLNSCSGVTFGYVDASTVDHDQARGAVMGEVFVTRSDYPDWYSELTTGDRAFDGALLRAALGSLASGETPRLSQREARYVVDRINAARARGDAEWDLPPQYRHGGGARRGVRQARLRVERGAPVERVPLRLASDVMAQLRDAAAARGVTVNALAASILEAALLGANPEELAHGSSAHGSSGANDSNDEAPF